MAMNEKSPKYVTDEARDKLVRKLNLVRDGSGDEKYNDLKWEYTVTDSTRTNEFLEAYEGMDLSLEEKFALMIIIIGSYNDSLTGSIGEKGSKYSQWEKIFYLLNRDYKIHRHTVDYWSCFGDELQNCFWIMRLIRTVVSSSSLDEAIFWYERGDYQAARTLFLAKMKHTPASAEIFNYLGRCEIELGNHAESLKSFNQAILSEPAWERPYFNKAFLLMKTGDLEQAEKLCEKAINLNEESEDAWYYVGLIHEEKGSIEAAKACYATSLELEPFQEEPHIRLGNIYDKEKDWDRSMAEMERALQVSPDSPEALYNIAMLHLDMNHLEKSRETFLRLLELYPDDREAAEHLEKIVIGLKS